MIIVKDNGKYLATTSLDCRYQRISKIWHLLSNQHDFGHLTFTCNLINKNTNRFSKVELKSNKNQDKMHELILAARRKDDIYKKEV